MPLNYDDPVTALHRQIHLISPLVATTNERANTARE
jgi:hypothetical protein